MYSPLVKKIVDTENLKNQEIFTNRGKIYTFLNPVSYLTALDNKKLFSEFDGIFADGSILVLAIKLLYMKCVSRKSFDMTSIAPDLLEYADKNNNTVYIVASKQEQVEKAVNIFKERYSNISFVGYRSGYFASDSELADEIKHICEVNPTFLIVGMGALNQEKFLVKAKKAGFKGIGFTCGGFIHQTSKNEIDYYPLWADKFNLRFVYRMYKEKHTRKRYLQAAFLFPIKFVFERIFG